MEDTDMAADTKGRRLAALWQGALLLVGLVIAFCTVYLAVYQLSWGRAPHWIEAFRDRNKLANLVENVRWPWIHQDTQYWIVRVRFDEGPIILEGLPPHARYWSVTYYAGQEENPSINNRNVQLEEDGTYRLVFTQDPQNAAENQIPVHPDVRRGVIELRITLQHVGEPALLPSVWQNGTMLVEGTGQ
jgi:hypothetical protein